MSQLPNFGTVGAGRKYQKNILKIYVDRYRLMSYNKI
jgi:hypothetical protein